MSVPGAEGLHVEAGGEGDARVVLAHGFAGSARNFRPQLRWLRKRMRTASYDARGHARSASVARGGFALDALIEDFAHVVGVLGGDGPLVVGGLSLGAATALHYALSAPERVRALVLASLPAGSGRAGGFSGDALAFADAVEREGLDAAGARFVWGPGSALDERGAALVRQGFLEHDPGAIAALLRETIAVLEPADRWAPRLAASGLPALLVAGADDAPSLAASHAVVRAASNARLVVIEGAGHVVNLAAPAAFDEAVRGFLDELGL